VIELRNEGLEKDKILISLVDKVKKYEANYHAQIETQKTEIEDLRRQLAEANEKCALAQANQEISEYWKNKLDKNVEELRESKKKCFEKSLDCVKKLKTSFSKVDAYSFEENFIRGDPEGVIERISGEAEAFKEILNGRGDICAFSGARGIAAILEKAGCDHVKTINQAEAAFSIDATKDPSAEATLAGRKFYSDVWVNGGRELAHKIIKKNEKDTHDAREKAKRAEEAAERERMDDTTEAEAMKTLTTFCGYHPLEMVMHPLGLFPAEKKDDPMWCNRVSHVKDVWVKYPDLVGRITVQCMSVLYRLQALQSDAMAHLANLAQTTKLTLDSREDFVVDLSSELVEKDLQVERLSQRITTLEQQVEIRDNTIDVLENQLHDVQQELEEANDHLDMHHLEMEANEAGSEGEEAPEELGPAPGANVTTSAMPLCPYPVSLPLLRVDKSF
jgi:uncharacterized coiled-coil protein SlyX